MVRVNRLLVLVAACGLAACDQMGTEPNAPVGMGRSNDNGSQFAPNPFPGLGSFSDEDGNSCAISWDTEQDKNDFFRTGPKGDRNLHIAAKTGNVQIVYGGEVWIGEDVSVNGTAHYNATATGFDLLNFSASGKVVNGLGEEGQGVCHLQVTNGLEFTKTDITVN